MTSVDKLAAVVAKWRRFARVDCDPANGNAALQAAGRRLATCAEEIEPILAELQRAQRLTDTELLQELWDWFSAPKGWGEGTGVWDKVEKRLSASTPAEPEPKHDPRSQEERREALKDVIRKI